MSEGVFQGCLFPATSCRNRSPAYPTRSHCASKPCPRGRGTCPTGRSWGRRSKSPP